MAVAMDSQTIQENKSLTEKLYQYSIVNQVSEQATDWYCWSKTKNEYVRVGLEKVESTAYPAAVEMTNRIVTNPYVEPTLIKLNNKAVDVLDYSDVAFASTKEKVTESASLIANDPRIGGTVNAILTNQYTQYAKENNPITEENAKLVKERVVERADKLKAFTQELIEYARVNLSEIEFETFKTKAHAILKDAVSLSETEYEKFKIKAHSAVFQQKNVEVLSGLAEKVRGLEEKLQVKHTVLEIMGKLGANEENLQVYLDSVKNTDAFNTAQGYLLEIFSYITKQIEYNQKVQDAPETSIESEENSSSDYSQDDMSVDSEENSA
eukprot:Pgem_evm1s20290